MKNILLSTLFSALIISCTQITGEKGTLTNEQVENYIKAYTKLKEVAPDILIDINENF